MSLFEVEHPIAQEISTIVSALDAGLTESDLLPASITVLYTSPLETFDGSAILQFTDRETENSGALMVPVLCDVAKVPQYTVMDQDGFRLTSARLMLMDVENREFPIDIGDEVYPSNYLQFDLTDEGVIFSASPNGVRVSSYGLFESELYYSWAKMASEQGSINKLYSAAIMHLAA